MSALCFRWRYASRAGFSDRFRRHCRPPGRTSLTVPARAAAGGGPATAGTRASVRVAASRWTGSSASCGGWRADLDLRLAAHTTMPALGRAAIARLGCAPASPIAARRHSRPQGRVLPFQFGVLPSARWAAALRPRAESAHPRGGELVDGPAVSCGCWRAVDVRQAARMTMPERERMAFRCPAATAAWPGGRGPASAGARGALGGGPAPAGRERPSARRARSAPRDAPDPGRPRRAPELRIRKSPRPVFGS